ncbi:serine/threonine-protein kinase [Rubrobacter calidifluminis]|uniref:serine/threonine-protein kinase n=1 Tax=Rubrobacter calidifluminis TaxID=1392640 RepID=UPI00235EFE9F|nr:serine/threonine-protein kinase [Rubrobacter calidifluminis]
MAEARVIEGQGHYVLDEVVGRGGFATVWRARARAGEVVAIKVIPIYSAQERSRALREGQIAEGLHHPNIVETIEVIAGETEVYLVTEFVEGMPLDEAARGYTPEEIEDALSQILQALSYAHAQGIIHRDIKPQNALVDRRGTVKLTDFGIAYRAGDTRLTRVGYAVGTPGYMAPEIMNGDADPSVLTDIYAVGATARTLLARQPYEPPERLSEFISRTTSPNPTHRPQSAREALALLHGGRVSPLFERVLGGTRSAKIPKRYAEHLLRGANSLAAGWLGYYAAGLLFNGAQSLGIAAGFAVLGYLLPRLAALVAVLALAVALLKSGQIGAGLAGVLPLAALGWIIAGSKSKGIGRLPLGPVLSVPLSWVGLGAGLPLFFGALMRPVGAAASGAAAGAVLVCYELTLGDGNIPYTGLIFQKLSPGTGLQQAAAYGQAVLQSSYHQPLYLVVLWGAIAAVVAVAERLGWWLAGLVVAVAGGVLGYALLVSFGPEALTKAMSSLGLAGIIYAVLRYLGVRAGR